MTPRRLRCSSTAAATGLAAALLLAACSSSSPNANTPTTHSSSSVTSSSPTDPTSTTATATAVGATSPAAPAGTKACALVSEQEAGAALGTDPGAGQTVTSHDASSCMYGTSPMILTVNLVPTGGKAAYDHLRHATAGQLVDISGVGDAAFGTFHGPAAGVDFYKGDTFVAVVLVIGQASTPPKDQATALAKTAASRI